VKAAEITKGIDSIRPKLIACFLMELEHGYVAAARCKRSGQVPLTRAKLEDSAKINSQITKGCQTTTRLSFLLPRIV